MNTPQSIVSAVLAAFDTLDIIDAVATAEYLKCEDGNARKRENYVHRIRLVVTGMGVMDQLKYPAMLVKLFNGKQIPGVSRCMRCAVLSADLPKLPRPAEGEQPKPDDRIGNEIRVYCAAEPLKEEATPTEGT